MKDARGEVLYVGKAQSLRNRVRELLAEAVDGRPRGEVHRIREVIDKVVDLEVTEVDSVSEALLLEANLIKRFKPRFNIRLKDDKSYPYIKITLGDDFPRIERDAQAAPGRQPLLRAVRVGELGRRGDEPRPAPVPVPDLHDRHQGRQAGPRRGRASCTTSSAARARASRRSTRRPTAATSQQVELFLEGNADALVAGLRHEMGFAAEQQQYEKAAVVRDKIRAIERTMESQKMAAFARTELDLAALARKDDQAAVQLFVVRNGKMLGRDVFFLDAPRDTATRRCSRASSSSTTRARRASRARSWSRAASPTRPTSRRS